jgi:predicted nucleic acid-binding protein
MTRSQPYHQEASAHYQRTIARKRRVVTTSYVITELVALAESRLRMSRQQLLASINSIIANPHVDLVYIDEQTHIAAWNLLNARMDKDWSLVDATCFVVMQNLGLTEALTTDHHFAQTGFVQLLK